MFNNSVNRAIIVGRLGKDPEIRYMNNGDPIANFTLATSEKWKPKDSNEYTERTEWHRVVVFGKRAEIIENHFHKGDLMHVMGKLQTRKWEDKEGNDKYTTEIVVSQFDGDVQMISKVSGSGGRPPAQGSAEKPKVADAVEEFDDDIPF